MFKHPSFDPVSKAARCGLESDGARTDDVTNEVISRVADFAGGSRGIVGTTCPLPTGDAQRVQLDTVSTFPMTEVVVRWKRK